MTLHIGAHMFIFSKEENLAEKGPAILKTLAEAGYEGTEGAPAGYTPQSRELLDSLSLSFCGSHTSCTSLEDTDKIIEDLAVMRSTNAVISGLLQWDERSANDYRKSCEFLNEKGAVLAQSGIRLHYHNHDFEFEQVDGNKTGMDLLLEYLDKEAVGLCLDLGWAHVAGADVPQFVRNNTERITYVHLRDFNGDDSCSLGKGEIYIPEHIKALEELPELKWVVVEQSPGENDSLEEMLKSIQYLKEM